MKIDELCLKKLILLWMKKYLDFQRINVYRIDIAIDQVLTITIDFNYYHVDSRAVLSFQPLQDKVFQLNGSIQYGFIELDALKVCKEYLPDNSYCQIQDDHLMITVPEIKTIRLIPKYIELDFI